MVSAFLIVCLCLCVGGLCIQVVPKELSRDPMDLALGDMEGPTAGHFDPNYPGPSFTLSSGNFAAYLTKHDRDELPGAEGLFRELPRPYPGRVP